MEPLFAVEITVLINFELTKPRRQMLQIRAMVLVLSTLPEPDQQPRTVA